MHAVVSQMVVQLNMNRQDFNDTHAHFDLQTNILLAWLDRSSRPNGPVNFALGSASSQLQEVLVTDLPRSFNRGEKPERGEGERERWKREGEGEGEDRKEQVFQLSLQHLSDPSGSGCVLSKKPNENTT